MGDVSIMKCRKILSLIIAVLIAASPITSFGVENSDVQTENDTSQTRYSEGIEIETEYAGEEETAEDTEQAGEEENVALQSIGRLRANSNTSDPATNEWTSEDFEYEYKSKLMYGCDYSRQLYVNGQVITGFSDSGLQKLDNGNTDLVIPSKTPDGETITGIGSNAFHDMGLTSVKFPTGMLVPYDDNVTHNVTRRGNFIIHESAFAKNNLTEVYLPAGVLGCMPNAFKDNNITVVTLPRTIWWIETLAFANNEIDKVNFPQTCDFRLEMHGMTFAGNNIHSVRIPDYTEVINKDVFVMNPGMEPMTEEIAKKHSATDWEKYMEGGIAESGIVYMYTDREALFDAQRIHTLDRPTKNQWSAFQKLVLISDENPDADTDKWSTADFTYEGTTITGLSASGIEKRKTHTKLDIPDRTPDGNFVREIAGTSNTEGGLFGAEIRDESGKLIGTEGFDVVSLPNGLEKIGDRAFAKIGLREVIFPNQLKEIGLAAFQDNKLEDVILPDSVIAIGGGAFASNAEIKNISIPNNETYTVIENGTFGCSDKSNWMTNLTSIEIPSTITVIGDNAFAGNNFESIEIPSSVKSIGRYAFSTKNYLQTPTTLILHEGLETIGSRAFRNKKIENTVLPSTLISLPANAFEKVDTDWGGTGHGINNPLVTRVFVTSEEQYNDKEKFPDSDWHKVILSNPNIWTAEDFEFTEINNDGEISVAVSGLSEHGLTKADINPNVVLPEKDGEGKDVKEVSDNAFSNKKLKAVTIPANSISKIGEGAFANNSILEMEFPEGIETINKNAFSGNKIKKVTMPSSLTMIGESAFADNKIDAVEFNGEGTSALTVSANAFAKNMLKSLQIADNLDVLSSTAFASNPGMKDEPGVVMIYKPTNTGSNLAYKSNGQSECQDITFGEIPPELAPWGPRHYTFEEETITGFSEDGEEKLKTDPYIILPGKTSDGTVVTTVGTGAFEQYGGNQGVPADGHKDPIKGVEFAPTITTIKMRAFQMCAIEDLVIPDTIKTLEPASFGSNYGMRTIKLSEGLTEIPDGTFVTNAATMDMNTGVHNIVIPEGVTRIGKNAFRGQHVRNLSLPSTLTEIDENAFYNHQIENLEIPESVRTIGKRAFMVNQEGSTPSPSELILHEGLTEIGEQAFGQTSLKSVMIPSTLTKIAEDAFFDNLGKSTVDEEPVDLRTSVADQAEGIGDYTAVATVGKNPKTGDEGGHRVIYDKMVGTGWDYSDFTYSADGKSITGWSDIGNQKRKTVAELPTYPIVVMPDKASYDSETFITDIADNAFALELYNEVTGQGEVILQKFDCISPYGIQRMELPEKLETIGKRAFEYNNLKALNLESAKNLRSIGESAFHGNHLFTVNIPDSVNELGGGAFAMNNIIFLTLSENVTKIPQGCFSMNIFMYEIEIPDTVTEIGEEAFAGARLEELEIPESVTKIGKKAFHLHHLTSLHIPGNVKVIEDSAFEGTYKDSTLTRLTFDEGVESIGKYAFKEALLEEVELPFSLKTMGIDPFYSNKGKDGSGVVMLYSMNRNHLDFNNDEYHGKEEGVSKHYHQVIYTGKDPVTITFDVNGGKALDIESMESDDNGVIIDELPVPEPGELTGVVFMGWYTAKEDGEEVNVGSSFARDVTIYARWTNAPFIVDEVIQDAEAAVADADAAAEAMESASEATKESAAAKAETEAKKALEKATEAERLAKEALRAAEIEDAAGSTEASRAKLAAATATLSKASAAKASASKALAKASEVIQQIKNQKAAAEALEKEWNGTISGAVPATKSVKAKAAKKKIKVSWKKNTKKNLKKYDRVEIQVCPDRNFQRINTKRVEVKKSKKSATIKGLKKKTTYYVRVRDVKGSGTGKLVSKWSKVKKAKVK